jgi:patatin-like phospholipase/acyl hydrolase
VEEHNRGATEKLNHPKSSDLPESDERFRILSLDGGGVKGTFSAGFLAEIEQHTGRRIVDHFDLIAGTSTGGIIALALGLGIPAHDILQFYRTRGPEIFPAASWATRGLLGFRHAFRSKHSPERLRASLRAVFGDRLIGESLTRLLIVSWDGARSDVHLYKTAHSTRFKRDYKLTALEAAMATSAAPTYLPAFRGANGVTFIDGGIWANCPAALSILEAIAELNKMPDEIDVLSVGTTTEPPRHVRAAQMTAGFLGWAPAMLALMLEAQVKGSLAQANLLTKHRMIRVNHVVGAGRFKLDDSRTVDDLAALGAQEARHCEPKITETFFRSRARPFVPCYRLQERDE